MLSSNCRIVTACTFASDQLRLQFFPQRRFVRSSQYIVTRTTEFHFKNKSKPASKRIPDHFVRTRQQRRDINPTGENDTYNPRPVFLNVTMSSGRRGRGGGKGGRSGGREQTREVQVSKQLSWLLRHGAESEKLPLGPGGYANVRDVLANRKLRSIGVTFDEVRAAVADNDKQRFSMIPAKASETGDGNDMGSATQPAASTDPADYLIRANQGHSIKVESDGLLEPLNATNSPTMAVHGTTHAAWPAIVASGGLKKMGRNHVHFAVGLPAGFRPVVDVQSGDDAAAAAPVISGMRNSSTVLIYLDLSKAIAAGLPLWRSENGVILSEGNADGVVPLELFQRVEDRTGEGVLVQDGQVLKQAPISWGTKKKAGP